MVRPVSRGIAFGSVLAALLLALWPALASATSIAGPNGKIAFASGRANSAVPNPADGDDSEARIWVADGLSGTPVQVTTLPANTQHRHPNWSPDHTRIVYAAGPTGGPYALWIVNLETGAQTEFVPAAPKQDRPTWSPDGKEIAYGSNGDLFMKETEAPFKVTQLTNTPGFSEERAVWSPDGNTLYYNREAIPVDKEKRDLYMKSPVTPGGAEVPILTGETDDWQPAVSPDGKRLCFLRGPQSEGADLWTVNVNGNGAAAFANTAEGELNCVWSPDGTRILYTRGAFGAGELASRDINGGSFGLLSLDVAKHFDGNADWATNFPPKCDAKNAEAPVNGFATIGLSCTDPDHGFGKEPPTAEALDPQALEILTQPAHGTLGGLSTSTGKIVYTPNKDFKGTDSFTYTGTDDVSYAPPATVTIHVGGVGGGGGGGGDKVAPTVSGVKISNKRWRAGTKLASISRTPVGTTISFKLSEAARATITFERKQGGKKAGSISLSAKAGGNKVRFQGLLSKAKRLAPGSYRLLVSAKDAAGNQSQPKSGPSFTIVTK